MSRFNHYAKELESMTFEAVNKIKEAEEKYNKALSDHEAMPIRSGFVEADYSIESQKRKVALEEAEKHLKDIRESVPNQFMKDIKEMRSKLSDDVYRYFAVKPEDLSPETMSLLNSGYLNINDFDKLMKAAIDDNNVTMIRMIGEKASEIAKNTEEPTKRSILSAVAHKADNYTPETYLNAFDSFVSVSERCMNRTKLIDSWNQIGMPEVVESF